MTSAIAIIVVLGGLIFFHELGHFLIARLFGMGVKAFSLGFGPKLFGFRKGYTEYKLSAFPLGGYVQLAGESGDPDEDDNFPEHMLFGARPAWQRMCVVAAGPIFNFVLAFLLFWILLLWHGQTAMTPKIGEVLENTPAYSAGLRDGDLVTTVDSTHITYWTDMVEIIRANEGHELKISVDRNGTRMTFGVTPRLEVIKNIFGEEKKFPVVGIKASGELVSVPIKGLGISEAATQTWNAMSMVVMGFVKLVERIIPLETLGGPLFLMQAVHEGAKNGLTDLMFLTAIISINLGIINLLPIPVLDGGHILYFTLEIILRRPISEKWRALATRMGILFLLALMTLAIFNDVKRIFF